MSHIIDTEPSSYEEAAGQSIWRNAMMEEYQSIMKNDVWDVVPRPKGKSVVTSKWIFKIKHVADGSVEKYKARFVARVSHRRKASTMRKSLLLVLDTPRFEPLFFLHLLWVGGFTRWT